MVHFSFFLPLLSIQRVRIETLAAHVGHLGLVSRNHFGHSQAATVNMNQFSTDTLIDVLRPKVSSVNYKVVPKLNTLFSTPLFLQKACFRKYAWRICITAFKFWG